MPELIRGRVTIAGNPISLGKASKKYQVPVSTLSDWAEKGELTILKRPRRKGQALLVDEASVLIARETHRKSWDHVGAAIDPSMVQLYMTPPPAPTPEYKTADVVEEYHHYSESREKSPLTIEEDRRILAAFAEKCPILPLTPQPIIDYFHDLPVGKATKGHHYAVIRAFYNYLKEFKQVPTPLTKKMIPRAEKHPYFRVLSREEVLKLFNSARGYQEQMILQTLYCTRVRVSELVSMTSDRLSSDHVVVTGKTGTFDVPITADLYDQLQLLGEGPLFRDRLGKPMTRRAVGKHVERCMKRAGIIGKKLGPHTLRHTSLTHLYEDTGDIRLVQDAAHHEDLKMTEKYTHPSMERQREKLLRFDPMKRLGPKWHTGPGDNAEQVVGQLLAEEEPEEGGQ